MITISSNKRARILRYYRYQSVQTEYRLAGARKTLQQLNHRREALEHQAAALCRRRDALAVSTDAADVTTAGHLELCRRQMTALVNDATQAENALRCHAQEAEAAQRMLSAHQKQLQQLNLKQQFISRNLF